MADQGLILLIAQAIPLVSLTTGEEETSGKRMYRCVSERKHDRVVWSVEHPG